MTAASPQILVVDDDHEIRKLLARYIESQGFRVLLAASCRELKERLATHQIDLVVLEFTDAVFGTLQIGEHTDGATEFFFQAAGGFQIGAVRFMGAVGKIHAKNIDPGHEQFAHHIFVPRGRAERGDNLGLAVACDGTHRESLPYI